MAIGRMLPLWVRCVERRRRIGFATLFWSVVVVPCQWASSQAVQCNRQLLAMWSQHVQCTTSLHKILTWLFLALRASFCACQVSLQPEPWSSHVWTAHATSLPRMLQSTAPQQSLWRSSVKMIGWWRGSWDVQSRLVPNEDGVHPVGPYDLYCLLVSFVLIDCGWL